MRRSRQRRLFPGGLVLAAVVLAVALAACGGTSSGNGNTGTGNTGTGTGGSGKPSYCAQVDSLEQSVTDLTQIKVIQHGTDALKAGFDKVKSNANATIDAFKSEFSSETSALRSSITKLSDSVKELSSSPVTAVAAIPGQVQAVSTAAKNLADAARSKCK